MISSIEETKEGAVQRRGLVEDRMIEEGLLEELAFQLRQNVSSAKSVEGCSRQTSK